MNLDKESKSEDFFSFFFFFVCVCGWGGEGGGEGFPTKKKFNRYSLIFCAHALYKISSSWLKWFSSFTQTKGVRGITLPMFYGIRSKVNIDLNQYSEFHDPSSGNSLHLC